MTTVHSTAAADSQTHLHDDAVYRAFLDRLQQRFSQLTEEGARPVFLTDSADLWTRYLDGAPDAVSRQRRHCAACRQFIERFGSLAVVDGDGSVRSALWDAADAPPAYAQSVANLARAVTGAAISGPFLTAQAVLGRPEAGGWMHLSLAWPDAMRYRGQVKTAAQAMAEKREDFKTVRHALHEFTRPMLDTALRLLKSDQLYSSERVLGQAKWLHQLHVARAAARGDAKDAVVWAAVATAPAGFCHPRSSMIGTLLEDIAAGLPFKLVARRFADKMHPLRYQRPQALPSAGNVAQAEQLFAQLGLAPALPRRMARLDELPLQWSPAEASPAASAVATGGVFSRLKTKASASLSAMTVPAITVTAEKFLRVVVPEAEAIEVQLSGGQLPFIGLTTAMDPTAPQLFQWNHPVAWYVWDGGAPASQYGLSPGWAPLSGITRLPARWGDDGDRFQHQGDGWVLLLEGARETKSASLALFPALLRGELHGVRSTIEAFSNSGRMLGLDEGSAVGIDLRQGRGSVYPLTLRVSTAGQWQSYVIDRWD